MKLSNKEKSMIITSVEIIEEKLRPEWDDFLMKKKDREGIAKSRKQLIIIINKLRKEYGMR